MGYSNFMSTDYKKTLNLPFTDFPMKADLAQKEPIILNNWDKQGINVSVFENRKNQEQYILHDGPPYANGHIHIGHALNKILKDIVVKYKTMCGYSSPYVPGWDCHGLPVEHQLFKELGITKHQIDQLTFRKKARKYAEKFVKIQCDEFKRLGIFGNWDDPYLTIAHSYEAKIAKIFGELYLNGYIYKGLKPIHWCATCETALAEAEVEYDNHKSPSVYVKFNIKNDPSRITYGFDNTAMVIWTTTPWTLPANLAIAVKEEFEYSLLNTEKGCFIIAKELIDNFIQKLDIKNAKEEKILKGTDLVGIVAVHPFIDRESPVILSDHVTLEQGTGCVHIAPGHGQEDYEVGLKYGLDIYSPVNNQGKFFDDLPIFGGKNVFSANSEIIKYLDDIKALLYSEEIEHSYPHCWRCKEPIIFRSTEQWFINVDKHNMRQNAIDNINKVNWIPEVGKNRITSMVENRPDWCLSRQRYWGVPIPVLYCKNCRTDLLTEETIQKIESAFLKESADAWFAYTPEELVGKQKCPKCGCIEFDKETDIIDVWFDSGVSHQAVLALRDELRYPADLYLEGSDQHRGWFQSSLLTAIGYCGNSPFKTVLTHGFVVDGEGKKMSKSLGNVISPQEVIKEYGADMLRLWVSSVDYTGDIRISKPILTQLSDAYRRIRNTFKYLLGNLFDFNPETNSVAIEQLDEIDKWALSRLTNLGLKVTGYYDNFEFYKIFHSIYQFCTLDMSSFYLDVLKDRMYILNSNDPVRRSSQTVIYKITESLVSMLAPILVFTTDEVWSYFAKLSGGKSDQNIHLTDWSEFDKNFIDPQLEEKWMEIFKLRTETQKVLENLRKNKVIGTSLEAKVILYSDSNEYKLFLKDNLDILKMSFIVSQVEITDSIDSNFTETESIPGLKIFAGKSDGEKCVRCWNYVTDINIDDNYPGLCKRCIEAITYL